MPARQPDQNADKGRICFYKRALFLSIRFHGRKRLQRSWLRINSSIARMSSAAMAVFDFSIRRLRPVMM